MEIIIAALAAFTGFVLILAGAPFYIHVPLACLGAIWMAWIITSDEGT